MASWLEIIGAAVLLGGVWDNWHDLSYSVILPVWTVALIASAHAFIASIGEE